MKRLVLICVFTLIASLVPIYAADSGNSTATNITNNPTHHKLHKFTQEKQLIHDKINAIKSTDPQKYQEIQGLKNEIKHLHQQIQTLKKQNPLSSENQIKQLQEEIKSYKNQILNLLGI